MVSSSQRVSQIVTKYSVQTKILNDGISSMSSFPCQPTRASAYRSIRGSPPRRRSQYSSTKTDRARAKNRGSARQVPSFNREDDPSLERGGIPLRCVFSSVKGISSCPAPLRVPTLRKCQAACMSQRHEEEPSWIDLLSDCERREPSCSFWMTQNGALLMM